MKKLFIALCAGLLVAANLCAVVLPDGQNVRADNVTHYDSGAIRSVTLRNTVEITTPIGPITTGQTVYYYENGVVKSIEAYGSAVRGKLAIQTNLGTIASFGAVSVTFTFYESGSLWHIDGLWGVDGVLNLLKTPNGEFAAKGNMLFYDSGSADNLIVHKANFDRESPATFTTKAATISLKFYQTDLTGYAPSSMEALRYGDDGFAVSFYKSGNLEKIVIASSMVKDITAQTSLGELFCRGDDLPLMFWEDGSLKQCVNDDVLQTTIYGKNVTVPVGGLLRFHKDGNVWAYTTTSGTSYTVGNETYKTTDDENTLVLDEAGNFVQLLNKKSVDRSRYDTEVAMDPLVLKVYDSGALKKIRSPKISFGGQNINSSWERGAFWQNENADTTAYGYRNKLRFRGTDKREYEAEIACMDFLIDMVYFADNGSPSSYDVIKTVVDADLKDGNISKEFRLSFDRRNYGHLFIEMTEDSEFVILPDRVRGLQFTRAR